MSKILLIIFVLVSCFIHLDGSAIGGKLDIEWTEEDYSNGYRQVGDMIIPIPRANAWGRPASFKWPNGRVPFRISGSFSNKYI